MRSILGGSIRSSVNCSRLTRPAHALRLMLERSTWLHGRAPVVHDVPCRTRLRREPPAPIPLAQEVQLPWATAHAWRPLSRSRSIVYHQPAMRLVSLVTQAALSLALAALPSLAQSGNGYLKTKVEPGRAGVFVDGKYVGPAANFGISRKYALAPGEHEIRLQEPRYEDVVTKVKIEPGKTAQLSQAMKALPLAKPPFGTLRTMAPDKFYAVYVNGHFMGHAGEFNNPFQGLMLNPGEYKVKILPLVGGEGHEEQVKIEADKTSIVRFK